MICTAWKTSSRGPNCMLSFLRKERITRDFQFNRSYIYSTSKFWTPKNVFQRQVHHTEHLARRGVNSIYGEYSVRLYTGLNLKSKTCCWLGKIQACKSDPRTGKEWPVMPRTVYTFGQYALQNERTVNQPWWIINSTLSVATIKEWEIPLEVRNISIRWGDLPQDVWTECRRFIHSGILIWALINSHSPNLRRTAGTLGMADSSTQRPSKYMWRRKWKVRPRTRSTITELFPVWILKNSRNCWLKQFPRQLLSVFIWMW